MYLYDCKTAKILEQTFIKKNQCGFLLMMRAAYTVLNFAKKKLQGRLWCVVGPGNNGGDAIGVAALALLENIDVRCIRLTSSVKGDAALSYAFSQNLNLKFQADLPQICNLKKGDVIIDGVFGIGISRPPEGLMSHAIEWINKAHSNGITVISIDVPSGLNATNGQPFGHVVKADATIMCLTAKQGCYTGQSPDLTGELCFSDLGIKNFNILISANSYLLNSDRLTAPIRSPIAHKGNYGNVLVLGGWDGMEGAGFLAGIAALRTGAGKVYICGPKTERQPYELINIPRDINKFKSILSTMDVLIVGPGLGQDADEFIETAWSETIPLIMDADGLRWLAKTNLTKQRKSFWIGTPHPGEAAALLKENCDDRFKVLEALYQKFGGKWVLKGPGTLIGPKPIFINPLANSALATAGSGDVLSGIIGGLVAQKAIDPELLGVYLHSKSACYALAENKRTLLASDIVSKIGNALASID